MRTKWPSVRTMIGHRLAMHLQLESSRLSEQAPAVSFTFDDLPKSAATTGAGILESYNAKGTFYVSGTFVGKTSPRWAFVDREDIVSLHERGHEIGCHTFSHKRASDLDSEALGEEIERNRAYHRALHPGIKLESFAYPYGYGSFVHKPLLRKAFKTCRSIVPGVNSGAVDMQFLRAIPLFDRMIDRRGVERAFDAAEKKRGWLIFYTHDVADTPSPFGCSPGLLNYALELASRRKVAALTMMDALRSLSAKPVPRAPGQLISTESRSHARL